MEARGIIALHSFGDRKKIFKHKMEPIKRVYVFIGITLILGLSTIPITYDLTLERTVFDFPVAGILLVQAIVCTLFLIEHKSKTRFAIFFIILLIFSTTLTSNNNADMVIQSTKSISHNEMDAVNYNSPAPHLPQWFFVIMFSLLNIKYYLATSVILALYGVFILYEKKKTIWSETRMFYSNAFLFIVITISTTLFLWIGTILIHI